MNRTEMEAYMSYKNRLENLRRLYPEIEEPMTPLLADYTCAVLAGSPRLLQQGRMYITFRFIYFYCRFLKYEHKILIHFGDIVELTKEKTALVFPNAIQIVTSNEDRNFFTSFTARDKTFDTIHKLWAEHKNGVKLTTAVIWDRVRLNYGNDLGFTTEDPEYEESKNTQFNARFTIKRSSEVPDNVSQDDSIYESFDSVSNDSREDLSSGFNSLPAMHNGVKRKSNIMKLISEDEINFDLQFSDASKVKSLNKVSLPKEVLVPKTEAPIEPASCKGHEHFPIVTLDEEFNINAQTLWTHLFTDSAFYRALSAMRMIVDIKQSNWTENGDKTSVLSRTICYTVNLKNRFGPKQSPTVEKQVRLDGSQDGYIYLIECTIRTVGIPLSDSFHVVVLYCILFVNATRTRLKVSMKVVYDKSVFFATKSIIESTVKSNFLDHTKDLKSSIINESNKISDNCVEEKVYQKQTYIEDSYNDPTVESFIENARINEVTVAIDDNKLSWMTMVITCCVVLLLLYTMNIRFSNHDTITMMPPNHKKESTDSSLTEIMNLIQEMKGAIEVLKTNIENLNKPHPCIIPAKTCTNN